ncbi:Pr6Pr family membrane protein [Frigoribacterium sp. SL97]|uniref:Pr6Pr family membrane protein n=1 Tax=Frigoribacterium sp. SL97 TaxID=2994664 RepID=UPI00226E5D77|nr:Pr6Pr family membrane protein [Frigoribacterium sp. SL97]WAC51247.1 Pr6Pr family membrane protein [Frigoribacterium sp. SL97]
MRRIVGVLRLLAAAVGVVALVADFVYVLGFSTFSSINYFSYFTQQSNMANVVVLAFAGVVSLRGRQEPDWFAGVHALVSTYVIVSGIVFGIIVAESASHDYRIEVPWSSQLLHFVIPTFVLVDWVFGPDRPRVRWRVLSVVLVFPLVWGVFMIVRGADVGWYPYFFLDPAQVTWPGEFLLYNGIALGTIVGVLVGLVALSHVRPHARARQGGGPASATCTASPAVDGRGGAGQDVGSAVGSSVGAGDPAATRSR